MKIKGNPVNVFPQGIYPAEVNIVDDKITWIRKIAKKQKSYLLPGFIDGHIHIESSMLCPS